MRKEGGWFAHGLPTPGNLLSVYSFAGSRGRNGHTLIPSFENDSQNYVPVVVAERGDRAVLETGPAVLAVSAKFDKALSTRTSEAHPSPEVHKAALDEGF